MTAVRTSTGAAAGWVTARWTAAAAAVSGAMARMRLASAAALTGLAGMATNGQKALHALRTASLGLLAVFGLAAFAAAKFDKAMAEVRAVTDGSAQDMAKLSQAALLAGRTTMYTASQAARAEAELARAGIATADIIGGALKGSLDLAASGQLDLGESAVISAQAMNAFKLEGRDVGHIADVISAGAGKSATNVHAMGLAFRMSALVANQTGLSLEQTVGTLSLFAQNALVGSDAGTSLKVMLQRLVPQSKEAAAMMDKLGFSAYDSQGNFVGLSELAARLKTSFGQLTPEARNAAMATIFGADAVRSATILYEAGAEGVNTWVAAVDDTGYATRVAATMTDNLAGDLKRLRGALETALIQSGSAANSVLRSMAQTLTDVVKWYAALPPGVQQTVTALSGLLGMAGLIGAGLLLMLPRIMTVRRELIALGLTGARVRGMLMGLGRLGLVVGGLAALSFGVKSLMDQFEEAPPNVAKLANSLVDLGQKGKVAGELSKTFGKDLDGFGQAVQRIAHPTGWERTVGVLEYLRQFGSDDVGLTRATDKVKSMDEALASLVQSGSPDVAAQAFRRMAREAEAQGTSTEKLKTLLPQYSEALAGMDTQQKLAAGGQKQLGAEASMTTDELQDQRSAADKLKDSLQALNGLNITSAEQEISFRGSLHSLTEAVKENGHSLDVTSEKGRAVKSAFLDAASAASAHAQAVADQKGSVEAGNAVLEQDIAVLKRTMAAAGFSESAIRSLTDAYANVPASKETTVRAPGAQSTIAELEAVKGKVHGVPGGKSITVKTLSAAAVAALEAVGFKTRTLPDKSVVVTVPTGGPISSVGAIQGAINSLRGRTITNYVETINRESFLTVPLLKRDGGIVDYYADGGMRERHTAQIAPAGAMRVWAEPETGGESYIPLALSKRPRSRRIAEETVRRLGGGPIQWYASGGINGISYSPTGAPALGGVSDPKQRVDRLVADLREAWKEYHEAQAELAKVRKDKKHTKAQLRSAEKKLERERQDVFRINTELGQSKTAQAPTSFNMRNYQVQLTKSLAATERWRANLGKVGARGGEEIRSILEGMGEDGYGLVNSLAGASSKQFKDITDKLKKTAGLAKASLADFNKQVDQSNTRGAQFAADLQSLAARGYGNLAQQLAAQGDQTAMDLARQAATAKPADLARLNSTLGKAGQVLTGDDLADSLTVLSALRARPGAGIAEIAAAGVDFATLRTLVPRMLAQINKLPEAYKATFLRQWAGQGGVKAMATGGILTGRSPVVLAGERGPESYIPLNGSDRSRMLLGRTARLMGYQMVPAGRYGQRAQTSPAVARQEARDLVINLYGAKQTSAEQARDLARHLSFVG
ncbi:phage tail tape measure protein [Streptomyces syringium]|uniref:phage tail tape measure protein n=1 Tax=Streptomyces syringium TaxID=76729 RepID=UPI0034423697